MGSAVWSDVIHQERNTARAKANIPAFKHDDDVRSGKVQSALHESLDPTKFKNGVREARDSDKHPNSVPIIFGLDETGSMSSVPRIVQSKLGKLMNTILTKGILADPQILFAAIGDAHTGHDYHGSPEQAPLQVGQFESGVEMEDDLTRFFLEAQGGGQNMESYDLLFHFAANHTATDAWDKRKRKGYLIMTGDEHCYPSLDAATIHRVFGGELGTKEYTIEQLVKAAQERYHCFFIIPGGSNHANSTALHEHWEGLLGKGHVIHLSNPEDICDTVATVIGITEGTLPANALETMPKAVKAAIDPVLSAANKVIDKAVATGSSTARL